jgi:hypothetical protein
MGVVLLSAYVAGLVLLGAVPAAAQESAPSGVKPVYALMGTGEELQGHLLRLGPDTLTLLVSGTRREVPLDAVLRIQTSGDPVRNGALIGAAVGFVWCAVICGQGVDSTGQYLAVVAANTAFFAALGTAIDASIVGRTTLYSRPLSSASSGIAFRLRF